MPLERLRVEGLRCLTEVDCRLHPRRSYFFGPNGAGKTSFLEAIYLLGRGRSFRTRQTRRLVQHGGAGLTVFGEVAGGEGDRHAIGVAFAEGELAFRVDREPARITDVARLLRVDVIDPSMHRLIEGGPSERRRFVDWGVFHVEQHYLDAWRRYRRTLGQRNAALKQGGQGELAVWDRALVEAAVLVDEARRRYVGDLERAAAAVGAMLLGAPIAVSYRAGWRADVSFSEALAESSERDAAAGFTQVGPHRGDLLVTLNGTPVADSASRGQQKLVAAALIIAQVRATGASASTTLLVDDPAAELDAEALGRLLAVLDGLECQLVLTGLSRRQLEPQQGFPVFHVEQGYIRECYNAAV